MTTSAHTYYFVKLVKTSSSEQSQLLSFDGIEYERSDKAKQVIC